VSLYCFTFGSVSGWRDGQVVLELLKVAGYRECFVEERCRVCADGWVDLGSESGISE
jgi:hypothetical protein